MFLPNQIPPPFLSNSCILWTGSVPEQRFLSAAGLHCGWNSACTSSAPTAFSTREKDSRPCVSSSCVSPFEMISFYGSVQIRQCPAPSDKGGVGHIQLLGCCPAADPACLVRLTQYIELGRNLLGLGPRLLQIAAERISPSAFFSCSSVSCMYRIIPSMSSGSSPCDSSQSRITTRLPVSRIRSHRSLM